MGGRGGACRSVDIGRWRQVKGDAPAGQVQVHGVALADFGGARPRGAPCQAHGPDGVVRQIAVSWGGNASAWTYTVTYSGLGATAAPKAPENAEPLDRRVPDGAPVPARPATK